MSLSNIINNRAPSLFLVRSNQASSLRPLISMRHQVLDGIVQFGLDGLSNRLSKK